MQDEEILIDKLEDQLIDHPDDITKLQLNASLDETFQEKLNAKAEQIANQDFKRKPSDINNFSNKNESSHNYNFLLSKSHLEYEHHSYGTLDEELNEWFSFNDFRVIGGLKELGIQYNKKFTEFNSDNEIEFLSACISKMNDFETIEDDELSLQLKTILYYAFGNYCECNSLENQLKNITDHNMTLITTDLPLQLMKLLKKFFNKTLEYNKVDNDYVSSSQHIQSNYFMVLTLIYFLINVSLFNLSNESIRSFKDMLKEVDLIATIFLFLEKWKIDTKLGYRIKNLGLILWKLILLEIGDFSQIEKCDEFLVELHKSKSKKNNKGTEKTLKCSPLDFYVFKEDLLNKYPLFNTSNGSSHSQTANSYTEGTFQNFMALNEHSRSISNSIFVPHSNKSHTIQSQLPAQTIHIATPVPSPNLAPSDYMSGGEKIRKSYQVNQSTPFIYPDTDRTDIPISIEEANIIMQNSVYDSYSEKGLWNERIKFMKQERGYIDAYHSEHENEENKFDYTEKLYLQYPNKSDLIRSLLRVEDVYKENFLRLYSLVEVFLNILHRNTPLSKLGFIEMKLGEEKLSEEILLDSATNSKVDNYLLHQLEFSNLKDISLKAFSNIVILLLKWFKVSHIMKYHYFATLLYDHGFISAFFIHLNDNFYDENMHIYKEEKSKYGLEAYDIIINKNKLMNPQIKLDNFKFFNNCLNKFPPQKFILINKTLIRNLPVIIDSDNISHTYIKEFNLNYCHILVNLFQITNKILIKNFSQRILSLNDQKKTEILKLILINYDNKYLSTPILKILKKMVPYQGRKWKSLNMDLISLIYMNLNLSMKDTWLSGRDLENEIGNAHNQDLALRSLLQFYNMRKYPLQMENLGFKLLDSTTTL